MRIGDKVSLIPRPVVNVFALVGQTYATTLLGLLIGILSARGLSIADRGNLSLFLLLTQLLSRLGSLGFEQIIQRQGLLYSTQNFYKNAVIGAFVLGFFCIPLVLWLDLDVFLLILMVFSSIIVSIIRINISVLIYNEMIKKIFLINFGQALLQLTLYSAVFMERNLNYFVASWILTVLLTCLLSVYIVRKSVQITSGQLDYHGKNLFIAGARYISVVLPEMAISFCLELPIIHYTLGAGAAGLYSIANTMGGIYYQVSVAISAVVAKATNNINRTPIYIILTLLGILFGVASYWMLPILFGEEYRGALSFLAISLPAVWLMSILRVKQMTSLIPLPNSKQILAIGMLILGFILSYYTGSEGVVYGVALTYASYSILSICMIRINERQQETS